MKPSTRLASLTHSDACEGVEGLRSLPYPGKTRHLDKGSGSIRRVSLLAIYLGGTARDWLLMSVAGSPV